MVPYGRSQRQEVTKRNKMANMGVSLNKCQLLNTITVSTSFATCVFDGWGATKVPSGTAGLVLCPSWLCFTPHSFFGQGLTCWLTPGLEFRQRPLPSWHLCVRGAGPLYHLPFLQGGVTHKCVVRLLLLAPHKNLFFYVPPVPGIWKLQKSTD